MTSDSQLAFFGPLTPDPRPLTYRQRLDEGCEESRGPRRLGQGQERCRGYRLLRALRGGVEFAQRLDGVAEELDAERVGGLGRKHIDDPAAHRILADVRDRLAGLVPDARQVLDHVVQVDLVPQSQLQGERPVKRPVAKTRHRRREGNEEHAGAAPRDAPQRHRAPLQDLRVRRPSLVG